MLNRIIPSTGEQIPVLGLGTWNTFDISRQQQKDELKQVLNSMKKAGSTLIDSSPMYGKAESVVGELTADPAWHDHFFYATKVWTQGKAEGIRQLKESFRRMGRTTMDLMQIHNLTDWKTQLQTLREWKADGKIRYIGITHYTDSMHSELERVFNSEQIDFVQFNYSIFSRNAEKRLLQAAADRGVATLINRPLGEGGNFSKIKDIPLPVWAEEYSIKTWSQYFLLYLISHPAVTVVIPATGNPAHAIENFAIATAGLPDQHFRERMRRYVQNL